MTTTPAPKGADIDNDKFRALLGAYSESVDRGGSRSEADEDQFIVARRALVAHINEQLELAGSSTSTSQGAEPIYQQTVGETGGYWQDCSKEDAEEMKESYGIDYRIVYEGAAPGDALDAARLAFMAEYGAWIAWGKDGESCRVFHQDEEGRAAPVAGWGARHWRHDYREAIDLARSAIAASTTQREKKS